MYTCRCTTTVDRDSVLMLLFNVSYTVPFNLERKKRREREGRNKEGSLCCVVLCHTSVGTTNQHVTRK